jgi:hypothetical protein
MGALTAIRKLQDQTTRLVMYLDALNAIKNKRDSDLTNIIINEARLLVPQTDRNGIHVRALLSFVPTYVTTAETRDEAMEFLNSAVTSINALRTKGSEPSPAHTAAEAAMAELNDPNSLLEAPEMERAFVAVGLSDLELGLTQAKLIQARPVQLMARLETIQGVIKQVTPGPKATPLRPRGSPPSVKP